MLDATHFPGERAQFYIFELCYRVMVSRAVASHRSFVLLNRDELPPHLQHGPGPGSHAPRPADPPQPPQADGQQQQLLQQQQSGAAEERRPMGVMFKIATSRAFPDGRLQIAGECGPRVWLDGPGVDRDAFGLLTTAITLVEDRDDDDDGGGAEQQEEDGSDSGSGSGDAGRARATSAVASAGYVDATVVFEEQKQQHDGPEGGVNGQEGRLDDDKEEGIDANEGEGLRDRRPVAALSAPSSSSLSAPAPAEVSVSASQSESPSPPSRPALRPLLASLFPLITAMIARSGLSTPAFAARYGPVPADAAAIPFWVAATVPDQPRLKRALLHARGPRERAWLAGELLRRDALGADWGQWARGLITGQNRSTAILVAFLLLVVVKFVKSPA